jgi:hypothetical protein
MADYSQQWREYRRLRNLALGVMISALIVIVSASVVSDGLVRLFVVAVAGAGVFAAAILAGIRVEVWRCPRCGRRFVSKWVSGLVIFFVRECSNCGLVKFTNGSNGQVDLGGRGN